MKIKMDYGKEGMEINVPDYSEVLIPNHKLEIKNPEESITKSLLSPINSNSLLSLYKGGMTVGISVCDHTRAQPRNEIITSILNLFEGIKKENFLVFIATGTHRPTTINEIKEMFNDYVISSTTIIIHNSEDPSELEYQGKTSENIPIELNKSWLNCDLKITTGFVEPHFFAGFSGGPKMVAPGLAGLETIMNLHDYDKINNKKSTWGLIEDNPIHKQISEISLLNKPDFSIDLTLNRENKITGIYSGELFSEHTLACQDVKKDSMKKTDKLYDLVITSNSGYPLDQNLYQSIKGVSAAAQITKPGGMIICVSECSDGIPFNSNYEKLLESVNTPEEYLLKLKEQAYLELDQWQVQVQAQIQENNKVMLYSKLNEKDVSKSHLLKINNIENVIEELKRDTKKPSICILPEGPQTIPYKI
jgi:nickel-dependent lactate racemase